MKYVRITVGDSKVCDSCVRLEGLPAETLDWWESSGLMPRVAPTECEEKCRCGIVPSEMSDIQAEAERLVNKAVADAFDGNIKIDLTTGRQVLLKEFEQIEGMLTAQYQRIAEMEARIYQWKVENDGAKLPKSFFRISDVEGMIEWLESKVVGVMDIVESLDVRGGGL